MKKFFFLLYFISFIWLLSLGSLIAPDSEGYIENSFLRPIGYPVFVDLFQVLLGERFPVGILLAQLILGFAAIFLLTSFFQRTFNLPQVLEGALFFVFLIPYVGPTKIGNYLLSEGLAYPLFLLLMKNLLETMKKEDFSSAVKFFCLIPLLMLIRTQFIFLFPVGLILLFHCRFFSKRLQARWKHLFLAFSLAFAVGFFFPFFQNLYRFGQFSGIPYSGFQLCVCPMYVANDEDGKILDPFESELFMSIMGRLKRETLNREHFDPKIWDYSISQYTANWNAIGLQSVLAISSSYVAKNWNEVRSRLNWSQYPAEPNPFLLSKGVDLITGRMAVKLWQQCFPGCLMIVIQNIIFKGLGGFFPAVIFFLLFFQSIYYLFQNPNYLVKTTFFVLFMHLSNILLVAIIQPVLIRFSIYTQVFFVAQIMIIAWFAFTNSLLEQKGNELSGENTSN